MDLTSVLKQISALNASDVFIVAGRPLSYKLKERIVEYSDEILTAQDTKELITDIYVMANNRSMEHFIIHGDDDFSFSIKNVARFRTNIYKQRTSYAAVLRIVHFDLPDPKSFSIPQNVLSLADATKGLILVTGASGCGKSTTLACMIDRINSTRTGHIVTLEDPIEFLHPHKKSVISQREISLDTDSYLNALRASLRQSPDVILIGELRDAETAAIAMTAAETGHMVITTLHTLRAADTVDRIIDLYPTNKQAQARLQLSMVLNCVITQQLVESLSGDIVPAFEIMVSNPAIRNLIREAKTFQIPNAINAGKADGMIGMDNYLIEMYHKKIISKEVLLAKCENAETVKKRIEH